MTVSYLRVFKDFSGQENKMIGLHLIDLQQYRNGFMLGKTEASSIIRNSVQ